MSLCEPWPLPPSGCPDLTGSPAVTGMAVMAASELLDEVSGHQFGTCPVTFRPCRTGCAGPFATWWDGGPPFGSSWGSWFDRPGITLWWGAECGSCQGACACNTADTLVLPDLVQSVTEVTVDGVVLPESAYNLFSGRYLVRTDGERWPMCQDWTVPVSGVGAWTVTAVVGEPVPVLGQLALGQLAAEYAKWCQSGVCKMPAYTTSKARQGVTQTFPSAKELREAGVTGWAWVDAFMLATNPDNIRAGAAKVWDPDDYATHWRTPGGVQ